MSLHWACDCENHTVVGKPVWLKEKLFDVITNRGGKYLTYDSSNPTFVGNPPSQRHL